MSASPPRSRMRIWLLSGGLLGLALWNGHLQLQAHGALREREQANRRRIAALRGQLESAHLAMEEIKVIAQQEATARAELDRWSRERQSGPTVVWFPLWLKAQLRRVGIVEAQIRLNIEVPEPGLPGFKRTCWHVNLPPQAGLRSMNEVMLAVKEIEQRERFVKILDCTFLAATAEPHWPAGGFNVEALVRE